MMTEFSFVGEQSLRSLYTWNFRYAGKCSKHIYEYCGSKFCMGKKNVEHDMSLF